MAPVHYASDRNDVPALEQLLDAEPRLIEDTNHLWWSPLFNACYSGAMGSVRLLLDRGAEINRRDIDGSTPLMVACGNGRLEVVALLLARGADPLLMDYRHVRTALHSAAGGYQYADRDYAAVIRLLLKDGRVSVDARDDCGWTALYLACSWGNAEPARVLLYEGGADHTIPSRPVYNSISPIAVARHRPQCLKLLEDFEDELEKAFLLTRARAVVDDAESISRAAEKAGAETEAQAQRAREEAAPVYLRGRVEGGEALPQVQMVGQSGRQGREEEEAEEEECRALWEYVVRVMKEDLFVEMMQGLPWRSCLPEEGRSRVRLQWDGLRRRWVELPRPPRARRSSSGAGQGGAGI